MPMSSEEQRITEKLIRTRELVRLRAASVV
jgi:hypothetical protein